MPAAKPALDRIWFTRCPVPTATGLAYQLGWLTKEFAAEGIHVSTLQEAPSELSRHHFDHGLSALIREGGSVPALVARAEGAPSRLIGLTWIDEWQTILVRPGSGITRPEQLKGARVALPSFAATRAGSFPRAMALQGIRGALALGGLTLDDVKFVEVSRDRSASKPGEERSLQRLWMGLEQLHAGELDAVYVKGAAAADAARRLGLVVGVDLDRYPDRGTRVNNGTPRPITAHEDMLRDHFDLVVRFLERSLAAADWAAGNLDGVRNLLALETRSGPEGVAEAYRDNFHRSLHPDLSSERVELLRQQQDFLQQHGFLQQQVDIEDWIDRRPLQAALELRAHRAASDT